MKSIKSIEVKGPKTIVTFKTSDQIRGYNELVDEENRVKTTLIRHKHFNTAFEQLTPHILIRLEIASIMDRLDHPIDAAWFKGEHWKDDEMHNAMTLTKVEFGGDDDAVSVKLWGTRETSDGAEFPFVTDAINFSDSDDNYEYPLRDILSVQVETLIFEAEKFIFEKKTGATAIQASMKLETPKADLTSKGEKKVTIAQAAANPMPTHPVVN